MSRHHCKYFGCQYSSARWSRLLPERSTLFGMRSAEIILVPTPNQHKGHGGHKGNIGLPPVSFVSFVSNQRFYSRSLPIKLRPSLLAVDLQCTFLANGIR